MHSTCRLRSAVVAYTCPVRVSKPAERIVLQCLYDLQKERGGRNVPTGMLYGTVVEHVDMNVAEMQSILVRLIGHPLSS